jgi:transposase
MYIEVVKNRNSAPAILLRESFRDGDVVKKRTIANLTHWDEDIRNGLAQLLKGAVAVHPDQVFKIQRSLPHGNVEAVLGTIKNIGLESIVASKHSPERDLVIAMVVSQILNPDSKLAYVSNLTSSSLAHQLGLENVNENDLYRAMDWLYEARERIEGKLAKKHLREGEHALYDVSSSYYEGQQCSLIRFGYNRDGKRGRKIIVYGALTNQQGCPVSVNVYPGNTNDCNTVADQVDKLRGRFGLNQITLVGDRGMLTQTRIEELKKCPGLGWISALKYEAIRALHVNGSFQLSIFDQTNIAEISSEDYPGERLIACYNQHMADHRFYKRENLLAATEREFEKIRANVSRRKKKILSASEIALKVGRVVNKYKMSKHFNLVTEDGKFEYSRNQESIEKEKKLDGIYIIRTSEPTEKISKEDVVRGYKDLSKVEQLFRTLKGIDIKVRPIRHWSEERVKAHIFICLLAYYVEWHMKKALAPLLFKDEELSQTRLTRDPVEPAEPSASAQKKKSLHKTEEGLPVQSFKSLMAHMATRTLNECQFNNNHSNGQSAKIKQASEPTPLQKKVFELLNIRTQ